MTALPEALLLARIQFAFTVSFHFLFPAFTIGLASYLAVLEAMWLKTGRALYIDLFRYWVKIFALVFAMGVVSGIVMSYQFGTNWAFFSDKAGPGGGDRLNGLEIGRELGWSQGGSGSRKCRRPAFPSNGPTLS